MGRIYWDEDQPGGRPDPRAVDEAAIREGLARVTPAFTVTQGEAAAFMIEHGAAAVAHEAVGRPGRQGDPGNG